MEKNICVLNVQSCLGQWYKKTSSLINMENSCESTQVKIEANIELKKKN